MPSHTIYWWVNQCIAPTTSGGSFLMWIQVFYLSWAIEYTQTPGELASRAKDYLIITSS